jgi:hypothetical protein
VSNHRYSLRAAGEDGPGRSRGCSRPSTRSLRRRLDPLRRRAWFHFRPPHCPNRLCTFYQPDPRWPYGRWGYYRPPAYGIRIPRWRCRACGRTFTARTFDTTYWLHRWDRLLDIVRASVAGSGLRQTARSLELAHSTVGRHLTRAGRSCLLFHRHLLQPARLAEPVVFDGFETFEYSQWFPCHLNLAVGTGSWFIYHFTDSPLRRKGAMTPEQKQRREQLELALGRPDPKAVEKGIVGLLEPLLPLMPALAAEAEPADGRDKLVLRSDEHPAYLRALRTLSRRPDCPPLVHLTTPSRRPRTANNPLFAVNLTDLLLRHGGANHRRETIAYSKRRQGMLERLAVFTVWRNAIKPQRERKPGVTAAMVAGILTRTLSWGEVFGHRRFPRERELPGVWWEYYWRRIKTAVLGHRQTENRARFAF